MRLKCKVIVDENEDIQNDEEAIKRFMKEKLIKFYVNLYKLQAKSTEERYLLDVSLFKGNPITFSDIARSFVS